MSYEQIIKIQKAREWFERLAARKNFSKLEDMLEQYEELEYLGLARDKTVFNQEYYTQYEIMTGKK